MTSKNSHEYRQFNNFIIFYMVNLLLKNLKFAIKKFFIFINRKLECNCHKIYNCFVFIFLYLWSKILKHNNTNIYFVLLNKIFNYIFHKKNFITLIKSINVF